MFTAGNQGNYRRFGRISIQSAPLVALVVCNLAGCSHDPPPARSKTHSDTRPKLTSLYQVAPEVDLLAVVDPVRDSVRGDFRRQTEGLIIPAVRAAQLNLDVDLPEQYNLTLEVAKLRGKGSLNLGITVGRHQTVVVLEGWDRKISGLNRVDGRLGADNMTSSRVSVFPDASARTIRIIVRRESVLVDVDNQVFIDYRGAASRLSFDDRFFTRPRLNQLMLGAWEAEFCLSKWMLTPLGEELVEYRKTEPVETEDDTLKPPIASSSLPPAPQRDVAADMPAAEPSTARNADNRTDKNTPVEKPPREPNANRREKRAAYVWNATPDPYPDWDGAARDEICISVPEGWVVVPEGPAPYFMVGQISGTTIRWTVYDVRSGGPVGSSIPLDSETSGYPSLCPSGRYMVAYSGHTNSQRVSVYSFTSGEKVYETDSPNVRPGEPMRDYLALNHCLVHVREQHDGVQFQRVDLRTGRVDGEWNAELPVRDLVSLGVSPGGRYVVANWRDQISVYDLSSTELVGRIPSPEGLRFENLTAFPIDGSESALLGRRSDRPTPTLWCIDWASGKTALLADLDAKADSLQTNYVRGPGIEWFPDKQLLLYYGRDVIDRRTGKLCYRIPSGPYWQDPRRTLSNRTILGMTPGSSIGERDYKTIRIDCQALESALNVVRNGGIAADVGLPPLTIPDNTGVRRVVGSDKSGPLTVTPFHRPQFPAAEAQLPLRLAQFQDSKTELRRIELADPPQATAIAHFTLHGDDSKLRQETLVRYDLARGEPAGSIALRSDFRLAAVSPSGEQALVGLFNEVDAYTRLDVIDLLSRKHVAGWRPFQNEPYAEDRSPSGRPAASNPMTATWVRFIDDQRVVAANPTGKLVCWHLPECKTLYECDDVGTPLALSCDRRYLAAARSTDLHLFDVQNGTWARKLPLEPRPQEILRAGFAPDNSELAALARNQGRLTVVFFNLASATVTGQFDLQSHISGVGGSEHRDPMHRQRGLKYRRKGYLMFDDLYLIDRSGEWIPWRYNILRGKHSVNDPDDREWFTEFRIADRQSGQSFEYWLTAAELPSDKVLRMIRANPPGDKTRLIGNSILSATTEEAKLVPLTVSKEKAK